MEQIVGVLKQAEIGVPVAELIRKVGISEQTFYRWKKQYVGLESDRKRDVLAVLTMDGDLRDRAVCVHDLFKWTRPVAISAYVSFAECSLRRRRHCRWWPWRWPCRGERAVA